MSRLRICLGRRAGRPLGREPAAALLLLLLVGVAWRPPAAFRAATAPPTCAFVLSHSQVVRAPAMAVPVAAAGVRPARPVEAPLARWRSVKHRALPSPRAPDRA